MIHIKGNYYIDAFFDFEKLVRELEELLTKTEVK